jgi:hypothetical protein
MKALIRDLKTGCFYKGEGVWTGQRGEGREFESTFQAMAFAEDNGLDGVEVVLTFDEPEKDVTVGMDLQSMSAPGNLLNL